MSYLGIDIGGSGIKSALVDVDDGSLMSERFRVDTPQPATPDACAGVVATHIAHHGYGGRLGVGFPAVVRNGTAESANNIDQAWIGTSVAGVIGAATGLDVVVINDADAAAVAEAAFGAAKGVGGLVLTITFGTGIGSGMLVDGRLVPNLELGQIELEGHSPAESYFSAKARRTENLDWDQWGARANRYLTHVCAVFSPDLMVIGGGLAKHWDEYTDTLDESLPLVPATLGNNAGLIGAALMAARA
ncbi:MAG: ROK family protein [Acidimicrobiia bacterium]